MFTLMEVPLAENLDGLMGILKKESAEATFPGTLKSEKKINKGIFSGMVLEYSVKMSEELKSDKYVFALTDGKTCLRGELQCASSLSSTDLSKAYAILESAKKVKEKPDTNLKKFNGIVIKHIEFDEASISDVVAFLSKQALELDPGKKGVNIVLQLNPEQSKTPPKVSMVVEDIPLGDAIKYVATVTGMKYRVDSSGSVIISK